MLRRPNTAPAHSRRVRKDDHDRFWWHALHATCYEPPIQATLDEWLPQPKVSAPSLNGHEEQGDGNGMSSFSLAELVYTGGCGLGILQRVA